MTFFKEAEDMPAYAMVQMVDMSTAAPMISAATAMTEQPRAINAKRSTR